MDSGQAAEARICSVCCREESSGQSWCFDMKCGQSGPVGPQNSLFHLPRPLHTPHWMAASLPQAEMRPPPTRVVLYNHCAHRDESWQEQQNPLAF